MVNISFKLVKCSLILRVASYIAIVIDSNVNTFSTNSFLLFIGLSRVNSVDLFNKVIEHKVILQM